MEKRMSNLECPHCGNPIAIQVIKPESKTEQTVTVDTVRSAISEWDDCVDIVEQDNAVVVTPKGYLGKEVWQQINDALKPFNPEWISAKKESRWVIQESRN